MAAHIHVYTNNPSWSQKDGTEVSSGTGLAPISFTLDASKNEAKAIKCAVRTDEKYYVSGNLKIKFVGENAAKWKIALDGDFDEETVVEKADWQDEIELDFVMDYNSIFWVKAESSSDESPQNDTSVSLQVEGLIGHE